MKKNLRELRQEHKANLEKIKALNKAQETRDLSESEDKQLKTLFTDTAKLKGEIEKRERIKSLELQTENSKPAWETEKRKYSFRNAVAMLSGNDKKFDCGFEKEVHAEFRKLGVDSQDERALLFPTEVLFPKPKPETRILNNISQLTQDTIKGQEYIPALYEKSLFDQLGVRHLSAMGKFTIPASNGTSASWFSGSGGSTDDDKITANNPTYSQLSFESHHLGAFSGWSLKQIADSLNSPDIESILREDLSRAVMELLFKSWLTDAGTGNKSPIKGIDSHGQARGPYCYSS